MLIKCRNTHLGATELTKIKNENPLILEIIAPELTEIPSLPKSVKNLKLTTPKLDFSQLKLSDNDLEFLKIKGAAQALKITVLPKTLKNLYLENVAVEMNSQNLPNLTEITIINCELKNFPFTGKQINKLSRLVLDQNKITKISLDILELPSLNHFSIEDNPLEVEFKNWLEKKFPHRF